MTSMSKLERKLKRNLAKASDTPALAPLENPVAYHIEQCLYAGNGNYRLTRLHLRVALGERLSLPNPFEVIAEVRALRDIKDEPMAEAFIDRLVKEARSLTEQGQTRFFAWQLFLPKKAEPFAKPLVGILNDMAALATIVSKHFEGTSPKGTNQILAAQLLSHIRYLLKQAEGER